MLPSASWFDSQVRSIFLRIADLSDDLALRASLPARLGGFGLRSVVRVSPIAYACSLAVAAQDIVGLYLSFSESSSSPSSSSSSSLSVSLPSGDGKQLDVKEREVKDGKDP